jgi:hypothetical protein
MTASTFNQALASHPTRVNRDGEPFSSPINNGELVAAAHFSKIEPIRAANSYQPAVAQQGHRSKLLDKRFRNR